MAGVVGFLLFRRSLDETCRTWTTLIQCNRTSFYIKCCEQHRNNRKEASLCQFFLNNSSHQLKIKRFPYLPSISPAFQDITKKKTFNKLNKISELNLQREARAKSEYTGKRRAENEFVEMHWKGTWNSNYSKRNGGAGIVMEQSERSCGWKKRNLKFEMASPPQIGAWHSTWASSSSS